MGKDPTVLGDRFATALELAFRLHAKQVRKGSGVPYVAHLLGTASIALEHGADEDEASAALLHDAIEDQGGPKARALIQEKLGERVASIVDGCTDADTIPKPPWRERKEAYIRHLEHASPSVLLVSISDKLYNARAILGDQRQSGDGVWSRFTGGRDGTLWYYRALVEAFRPRAHPGLVAELDRVVSEIERLAKAAPLS